MPGNVVAHKVHILVLVGMVPDVAGMLVDGQPTFAVVVHHLYTVAKTVEDCSTIFNT